MFNHSPHELVFHRQFSSKIFGLTLAIAISHSTIKFLEIRIEKRCYCSNFQTEC